MKRLLAAATTGLLAVAPFAVPAAVAAEDQPEVTVCCQPCEPQIKAQSETIGQIHSTWRWVTDGLGGCHNDLEDFRVAVRLRNRSTGAEFIRYGTNKDGDPWTHNEGNCWFVDQGSNNLATCARSLVKWDSAVLQWEQSYIIFQP